MIGVASYALAQCNSCTFNNPCPQNCSVEPIIVGTASGARVGNGFVVTVRNDLSQPVANSWVVIDFTDTAIIPFGEQVSPTVNNCGLGYKRIQQQTNSSGQVVIDARMSGFDNSGSVKVYASAVSGFGCNLILLAQIKGRSTDCVTSHVTGQTEYTDGFDLNYFRNNYLNNPSAQETDFNEDGTTNGYDFDIFRAEYLANANGTLCVWFAPAPHSW